MLVLPAAGPLYAAVLVGSLGPYLLAYWRFRADGTESAAVRAFYTANLALAVLFVGWAVGGLIGPVALPIAALVAVGVPWLFGGLWRARPSLRGVEAAGGDGSAVLDRLRARVRARGLEG